MGFLSPWFLVGLAAIGLPIYLHLLRRHVTTPLPFSSLMFFERGTQSSTRHRRLRYLLLFALRAILLLLLVVAFANPFIRWAAAGANNKLLLVVVDHSFSMKDGSRFADGAEKQKSQASLTELADRYLTKDHRDDLGGGCLLAAIGGDMARQNAGVRHVLTVYVRGQIDRITTLVRGKTEDRRRKRAIATLSGLVGALTIARAVDDSELSDEILEAARSVYGAGEGL